MTAGERIKEHIGERRGGVGSVRALSKRLAELFPEKKEESWRRQIYQWMDGATPDAPQAAALAAAFGVPEENFSGRPTAEDVSTRQVVETLTADLRSLEARVLDLAKLVGELQGELESLRSRRRSRPA